MKAIILGIGADNYCMENSGGSFAGGIALIVFVYIAVYLYDWFKYQKKK
jgi:hypothetical protein